MGNVDDVKYARCGEFRFHIRISLAETENELIDALQLLLGKSEYSETMLYGFEDYCLNFPEWVLSAMLRMLSRELDLYSWQNFGACLQRIGWVLKERPDLIDAVIALLKMALYNSNHDVRYGAEIGLFNLDTKAAYDVLLEYANKIQNIQIRCDVEKMR